MSNSDDLMQNEIESRQFQRTKQHLMNIKTFLASLTEKSIIINQDYEMLNILLDIKQKIIR